MNSLVRKERNNDDAAQWEILRNSIATDMWRDYASNPTWCYSKFNNCRQMLLVDLENYVFFLMGWFSLELFYYFIFFLWTYHFVYNTFNLLGINYWMSFDCDLRTCFFLWGLFETFLFSMQNELFLYIVLEQHYHSKFQFL